MSLRIRHITVDCADPYRLAAFWSALLGYREDPAEPNRPDAEEALLIDPRGEAGLLFLRVPEPKAAKNRLHFDLWPDGPALTGRDQALAHVLGLGARVMDDRREPDGTGWVVLADPEGNEFCLERARSERAEQPEIDAEAHLREELDLAYDRQLRLLGQVRRRLTDIGAQRKRLDLEVSVAAARDPLDPALESLWARVRERTAAERRTQALAHELQAEVSSFWAEVERHRAGPAASRAQASINQLNALLDTLPGLGRD